MRISPRKLVQWTLVASVLGLAFAVAIWCRFCFSLRDEFHGFRDDRCTFDQAAVLGRFGGPSIQTGWRRQLLWLAITAPSWMIPGDARSVRKGGAFLLVVVGPQPEEEADILDEVRRGMLPTSVGATLLGALWFEQADGIDKAFALLDGGPTDQLIAFISLPILTGYRLYDATPIAIMGLLVDELNRNGRAWFPDRPSLISEWQQWRASHPAMTPQDSHTESFRQLVTECPAQHPVPLTPRTTPQELESSQYRLLNALALYEHSLSLDHLNARRWLDPPSPLTKGWRSDAAWALLVEAVRARTREDLPPLRGLPLVHVLFAHTGEPNSGSLTMPPAHQYWFSPVSKW